MATSTFIPVEEYLRKNYRPDCDYVDGVVMERHLGTTLHSAAQAFLVGLINNKRKIWGLRGYTEQRVQVKGSRFRIPDVCAVTLPASPGPILHDAPFICVEVLSPEDSLSDMIERWQEYLTMGVAHVWVFDPVRRSAWIATDAGLLDLKGDAFEVPGTPIRIPLAELNAELDDIAAGH